jgi:membrane protease YdiL (CAAX protease family)
MARPEAPWIALIVSAVAFGMCHWLDAVYACLTMLAGVYFGLLLLWTGSLWTPIAAHAAYDLLALIYLIRPSRLVR